jgi:predicted CXXCH cytochrome family protein
VTLRARLVLPALATLLLGTSATHAAAPAYVGSAACASCHAEEHARWRTSQHAVAMQAATAETVLGRFDGATVTAAGVTSTFSTRDGKFFVRTDGPDGRLADFEVKYTFGVYPLQQYLVPFPDGRLQALGIAWDARSARDGGQRWFHLYPDAPPPAGSPLHWTGIDQTWNYQCAHCHSTDLQKRWDATTRRYATTWSEIDVGCEACHGPGATHVAWAKHEGDWQQWNAGKGLTVALDERRGVTWAPAGARAAPARSTPRRTSREIETCAPCHARREQFSDGHAAGTPFHDAFRPALLETRLYHPDGQQRDEVYTWGSFLQSKMFAAGVTCGDCHEPHTEKLRAPGNAVCASCHTPAAFDTPAHHHHAAGSAGAQCTACHMPTTTYMVIDPRHDHSLRIPRPDRTTTLGTPNACTACHAKESARWASDAIARWYPQPKPGFERFAEALAAGDRAAPGAGQALGAIATDATQSPLARASAIARLPRFLSPKTLPAVAAGLRDADPTVRAASVRGLMDTDAALRVAYLPPLLTDPVRLVRMDAGRALADVPEAQLAPGDAPRVAAALNEWIAAQRFNADRPEAHLNLAGLAAARGRPEEAVTELQTALVIDPTFTPAAVNLADVHRAAGREAEADAVLRAALARNPKAAAVHHALGLSLIRQQRTSEALAELRQAAELEADDARFAYVYAVALHDTGDRAAALRVLDTALGRHPYDRELLMALVSYQQEAGDRAAALTHARVLRELEPENPQVAQLVQRLEAPAPPGP